MTKTEAALVLIADARRDKSSNASAKKVVQACKVLEVDPLEICRALEFCNAAGEPYADIKPIWFNAAHFPTL